jgi:hypothetical protein
MSYSSSHKDTLELRFDKGDWPGLLSRGVLWDPLGPSPDRESAIGWVGNAPALVPEPLTRM